MKVGDEMFQCYICYEKVESPHMCPCCSKPACYHCFIRCIEIKSECPNCRTHLSKEKLVNCRWMKEIQEKNLKEEKCFVHSTEILTVFCATCQTCVCDQCVLWDKNHSGHVIQKLDDIYNHQMKKLKRVVSWIEQMKCLTRLREGEKEVDVLIEKLTQFFKMEPVDLTKFGFGHRIEFYSKLQQKIEEMMKTLSKKDLISATKILLEKEEKHPSSQKLKVGHTSYNNPRNPDGFRSLLVSNVSPQVEKEDVHNMFSKYGQLNSVSIDEENGCAYVKFMSRNSAGEAMHNLQFANLFDQKLVLKFIRKTSDEEVERLINPDGLRSLWVGNVVPELKQDALRDMFSKYGVVQNVRNIPSKFCAFVDFVDKESAEKAMQKLQSVSVLGTKLSIQFANKEKPNQCKGKLPNDSRSLPRVRINSKNKFIGPVNGRECYFWRRKGCRFSEGCRYEHIPENEGIDLAK